MRPGRLLLGALLLTATGCHESSLEPVDGLLEVVLTGSAVSPGALVFQIQGGTIDSIEAAGYYTASAPSGNARRVLVAGDRLSGRLVLLHVPDAGAVYQVVVQEAADRTSYALLAPGQVQLQLRRVYR